QWVDALRFGNRLHEDTKTADRINMLASTIDALAGLVPGELRPELALNVAKARAFKLVKTIEITLESASDEADEYGFRDVSREGIENRRVAGRAIDLPRSAPNSTSFGVAWRRGSLYQSLEEAQGGGGAKMKALKCNAMRAAVCILPLIASLL